MKRCFDILIPSNFFQDALLCCMTSRTILLSLGLILGLSSFVAAPALESHQWFTGKGKKTSWEKVLKEAAEADIIFFGESHNDPHAHWYEKKLAEWLISEKGDKLVFGCEMLESDDQLAIDEYLAGFTNYKKFAENARLWDNHKIDYQPMVDLAKKHHIPMIATNIPRRYASMVFSGGFEILDTLSPLAKSYIAPLPVLYDTSVACYNNLLHSPMMGHSSTNLPKAQAIKDATMAHFILKNWKKGQVFYHWNGSYHSNNHEGIVWYLKQANPDLKIYVISNFSQKEINALEKDNENQGDAVLITDESFPTSY